MRVTILIGLLAIALIIALHRPGAEGTERPPAPLAPPPRAGLAPEVLVRARVVAAESTRVDGSLGQVSQLTVEHVYAGRDVSVGSEFRMRTTTITNGSVWDPECNLVPPLRPGERLIVWLRARGEGTGRPEVASERPASFENSVVRYPVVMSRDSTRHRGRTYESAVAWAEAVARVARAGDAERPELLTSLAHDGNPVTAAWAIRSLACGGPSAVERIRALAADPRLRASAQIASDEALCATDPGWWESPERRALFARWIKAKWDEDARARIEARFRVVCWEEGQSVLVAAAKQVLGPEATYEQAELVAYPVEVYSPWLRLAELPHDG